MSEEEKPKEEKPKETITSNIDESKKYETTPVIERAREEREKLEAAIAAQKAENDRTEQIMTKRALGGMSEAGQDEEVKEETAKEYADRIMNNKTK